MHTPILEPVEITKAVKYFRVNKNAHKQKTVLTRCLKFVLKAKDTGRFIDAGKRTYGGQQVLFVNYRLR
jgi:hypothetical protein